MTMKEKIAYLRGLMEGMQLPDDNNGKLMRAIADCLDAIADEVEVESARTDVIEEQLDDIDEELDSIDELFDALLEDDDEDEEDFEYEEDEDEDDDEADLEYIRNAVFGRHEGCCGHHGHGPHHGRHGHGCCGHHHHHDEDEEFNAEEFMDSFNYFTCPTCGEIVPITDDMLEEQADPICPNCNNPIFGAHADEEENKDEE